MNRDAGQTPEPPVHEARAEILRLIAKLHGTRDGDTTSPLPSPARTPGSLKGRPEPGAALGGSDRHRMPAPVSAGPARGDGTLAQIKSLRRRLEEQVSEAGLVGVLRSLEERVARIEARLQSGRASIRPSIRPSTAPALEGHDDATLRGLVHGQLLADILQLISSNALTGVFAVKSGGVENRMYFDEGQICHAEGPGLSGENALFATLAFEEGTYAFHETNDLPEEKSITSNTQFLILEALRRIDEQGES